MTYNMNFDRDNGMFVAVGIDYRRGYIQKIETGEDVLKIETVLSDHVHTGVDSDGFLFRGVFVGKYRERALETYGETESAFLIDGAFLYRIALVTYDDIISVSDR